MQWWKKLRLRISQFYFLRYHGFIKVIIKKLSFNISKSTLIIFAETFFLNTLYLSVVSHFIIFIKIGTACRSFSRLNFVMYVLFLEDDLVL